MDIFEMRDYREFLLLRIENEKSNYVRFSEKYSKHVSLIALKRLLSRGRNKRGFLRNYKMSNDRFVDLLFDLRPKLSESEVMHLTFIKIIQDSEVPEFGIQSRLAKLFLKNLPLIAENSKSPNKKRDNNVNANVLISEGLINLSIPVRRRTEQKIFEILLTPLMRENDHPDIGRIIKKIKEYKIG